MEKKKKISTKQRILNEAIRLYNENGAHNITSRHIAAELGISHGNLDYHYNNREAILLAIYKQMREEMTNSYQEKSNNGNSSFDHFHLLLMHLERFQMKYRFFNLDVLEMSRSYPEVSKLLKETIELRKEQMSKVFKSFVSDGLLEDKSNIALIRLQHTIRIIITFWLSQREVLPGYRFNEKGEMTKHIWDLLIPYMTEKGLEEYKHTIEKYSEELEEIE
ncbi:TetR/AcrR family transcriptional regulator [Echinicola sp. CAU 1574]|uniref:TetR/AcrR family transcriptional regulator n=1 Tax=Echinicola arenosa TaxID=2774144 RepID=A0ABR9AM72_9BACT|nr:TetR/AcrR family transcriptional regulator [Echinicola arenosa]MBD8488719.1 TetR/AcrR family transcriptional regulator [Echinicola arenosa]